MGLFCCNSSASTRHALGASISAALPPHVVAVPTDSDAGLNVGIAWDSRKEKPWVVNFVSVVEQSQKVASC